MNAEVEETKGHNDTVWSTPTRDLVPDVFFAQEWLPPMLGIYKNGRRERVDLNENPFFRSDRIFGDWDKWQRKLQSMSYCLELNEPPVSRLKMEEDLSGKQLGYNLARKRFLEETIIPETEMRHLLDFALYENNPLGMRRMAKAIATSLTTQESVNRELQINALHNSWRSIRQKLSFRDIKGADALTDAIRYETDTKKKQGIICALNKQNTRLADIFIQKRNIMVPQFTFDSRHYSQRALGFTGFDSESVDFSKLFIYISETWRSTADRSVHKIPAGKSVNDSLIWHIGEKLQLEPLVELIKWRHSNSMSRLYLPFIPYEVVAAFDNGKGFEKEQGKLHEIGHAFHLSNIDERLPYVIRNPDYIWSETMAIYFDGLSYSPDILLSQQSKLDIKISDKKRLIRALGSMASCIAGLQWEQWFYAEDSTVTITSASEYYSKCLETVGSVPDDPSEWANNIYLGSYPWYGVNYVIAFMAVEQLRSYAEQHFGGVFTPEAAWWLHEKCWWPGGALGWRDLIQHATGEEFNPEYFFKALKNADIT